jgi:integrase
LLTDQAIRAAITRAKVEQKTIAIRDAAPKGLELRVNPGGTATFAYCFKVGGKPRRLWLGNYGPHYKLADARTAALVAQGQRAAGEDPVAARDAAQAAQKRANNERRRAEEADCRRITVAALCDLFLKSEDRHRSYPQIIAINVTPAIGKMAAADVKRADIQRIVDDVKSRGAPTQARRVFEVLRAVLRWGVGRDYLTGEPWRGVALPEKGDARTRVLTAAEIKWLWEALEKAPINIRRILRLQILIGQRSGEIAGISRSEIAVSRLTWTIPGERTKNGETQVVPLPPRAREIIGAALTDIDEKAVHLFVGGRGAVCRSDSVAHELADLISTHNEAAEEAGHEPIEPFTAHDLRRTMATGLQMIGIPMPVISAALNHISAKASSVTTAHYAHADLTMEVRAALTRWQAVVGQCVSGEDPFEVRVDDIEELECRMLARGAGVARLRVVR